MDTAAPQTLAPNSIGNSGIYGNPGFDFVTRSMFGYAAQGVIDVGQVFATIARIKDGDVDGWYAAWRETAEKLHDQAKAGLAAGHTDTAHRRFLAASEGYAQAVAFADGQTDQTTFAPTFALQTEAGRRSSTQRPDESSASPFPASRPRCRDSYFGRTLPAPEGRRSS